MCSVKVIDRENIEKKGYGFRGERNGYGIYGRVICFVNL